MKNEYYKKKRQMFYKKWIKGQCRHLCILCDHYYDCSFDYGLFEEREKEIIEAYKNGFRKGKEASKPVGEWIPLPEMSDMYHDYYKCSLCGLIEEDKYPYCHCGAIMK